MEVTKDKQEMGMVRTTLGESQPLATMYAKEMKEYKNDILGIREYSWTGAGAHNRRDSVTCRGGRSLPRRNTCNAITQVTECSPVGGRIITARFYSKHKKRSTYRSSSNHTIMVKKLTIVRIINH